MGSKSSVPEKSEGDTAKSEKALEVQPDKKSADSHPNEGGGGAAAMNPVDSSCPDELPPNTWCVYTGREVKEDDEHRESVQERAEEQIGLLEEAEPGEDVAEDDEHAHYWSGARDLPESAANEIIVPHKEGKLPPKDTKEIPKGVAAWRKE